MKEMTKLQSSIDKGEEVLRKFGGTQEAMNRALKNMSGASVNDLKGSIRAIEKNVNSGFIKRATKERNEQTAAVKNEGRVGGGAKPITDGKETSYFFPLHSTLYAIE